MQGFPFGDQASRKKSTLTGESPLTDRIFTLTADSSAARLDRFVIEALPELSRGAVQRLIEDGAVTVNGKPSKAAYKIRPGDSIVVRIPPPPPAETKAEAIPLDIVHEDADLIVINKPAGMVVHPAAGHTSGTLVNAVLAHCPELRGVGEEMRSGIVHRLDKDTSGLILVAKNEAARENLQHQFKSHSVAKVYIALVEGHLAPPLGLVDVAIGRDKQQHKRMAATADGRPSRTAFKAIEFFDKGAQPYTLVEVRPQTGRTHQIRVHFAWMKFPIAGDTVYGRRRPKHALPLRRHFLHAQSLTFRLPSDGREVTFTAPLPSDLAAILESLRAA
jgi:23S rRNA pseudouridine1911/1915/1917 synthase